MNSNRNRTTLVRRAAGFTLFALLLGAASCRYEPTVADAETAGSGAGGAAGVAGAAGASIDAGRSSFAGAAGRSGATGFGGFVGGFAGSVGVASNGSFAVGTPCVPIIESRWDFASHGVDSILLEFDHPGCFNETCLVNHFQGRVSCPYGNAESEPNRSYGESPPGCTVPDSSHPIELAVEPQLRDRLAQDAVFCTCRCNGPDPSQEYCECPPGFGCVELVEDLGLPAEEARPGSYCVPEPDYAVEHTNLSAICRYSQRLSGGDSDCGAVNEDGPYNLGQPLR